ncbi:hypothetical protein B5807_03561 [Epicoccum nigrum]|uniref:SRR1-like domain-containing protein n=1 Tax=Epicoccum nigrum TaxID=105696 RepID=A0A1Y2M7D7_EPING|nr:hypothetical protein B5807_03561 [Epicoccum nigrum]
MPHAIHNTENTTWTQDAPRRTKGTSLPRELQQLTRQLIDQQDLLHLSQLSIILRGYLQKINKTNIPITRIVSLGLGSLLVTKSRPRRLKQLAILLSIRDCLQSGQQDPIEVYAQDPDFTRQDKALLAALDIRILRTPSSSELGEADSVISPYTLVYSPFLTLEAYEQLISRRGMPVRYLIGDDFDALVKKWPNWSAERRQVEGVLRSGLSRYRRKALAGEGFWTEEDETFPMALYVMNRKVPIKAGL